MPIDPVSKPDLDLNDLQYLKAGDEIIKKAKMYGPPIEHFKEVARRWSARFGCTIKASDVCFAMGDLKDAREKFRHDPDNILDRHGYGLLGEMCLIAELKEDDIKKTT